MHDAPHYDAHSGGGRGVVLIRCLTAQSRSVEMPDLVMVGIPTLIRSCADQALDRVIEPRCRVAYEWLPVMKKARPVGYNVPIQSISVRVAGIERRYRYPPVAQEAGYTRAVEGVLRGS